ncbi:hypothetical protein Cni_G14917 [Canna indica]|uniref:C2H2-type domain-containing protein n=1 Tax=Canna indica TaxID=4628 RepID=A0AAQ3KF58_9LILI|nr:hypothetical protein Cni_G14917 [Canna indica]
MEVEAAAETVLAYHSSSCSSGFVPAMLAIVKGKRTKRRRIHLPPASSAAPSDVSPNTSSADASDFIITEEEEDMANCLILLAQGRASATDCWPADKDDGVEACVYQCTSCNKSFPSFQALGGHRAGHKKPRLSPATVEKKKKNAMVGEDSLQSGVNSFEALVGNNPSSLKAKVHECSVCGSEFSSGQALGGHMRRHRPLTASNGCQQENMKRRSFFSLDLNLPAPADDEEEELGVPTSAAFMFIGASTLVDCHY